MLNPVDTTELLVIVRTSFLAITPRAQHPIAVCFALGHSKARIINYAILIAFFGAVWLAFPVIRHDLDSIATAVSSPIFYATTLIGGASVLRTSALLAIRAYQN
ncbi:hypothetical protein [Cryobacterium sp. M96]|uniref:hypothetical protein n=1 Tax=Cryobacterium sp. M96 TaxID=2048295 RepID=UPI0011B077A1|nr:hypothetical protein [Cryobacterium sp. M96]